MYNDPGRVTATLLRDGYAITPFVPHTAPVRELVPALIDGRGVTVRANQYAL